MNITGRGLLDMGIGQEGAPTQEGHKKARTGRGLTSGTERWPLAPTHSRLGNFAGRSKFSAELRCRPYHDCIDTRGRPVSEIETTISPAITSRPSQSTYNPMSHVDGAIPPPPKTDHLHGTHSPSSQEPPASLPCSAPPNPLAS